MSDEIRNVVDEIEAAIMDTESRDIRPIRDVTLSPGLYETLRSYGYSTGDIRLHNQIVGTPNSTLSILGRAANIDPNLVQMNWRVNRSE